MMPPLDARAIEHRTIRRVLVEHLALEDAPVFEREMKDVAVRGVGHGIEADHSRRAVHVLQAVTDAPHVAVTTIQTPHSIERRCLRHLRHTCRSAMQRLHLPFASKVRACS